MQGFMIMPFNDRVAESFYRVSHRPICKGLGVELRKADEILTQNPIWDDIVAAIQNAKIIVADISRRLADGTPNVKENVYYELGMAHILKPKQTIMVTHDDLASAPLPFDIAHFRVIHYQDTAEGKVKFDAQFTEHVRYALSDYQVIFRDEFDLIIQVFQSSRAPSDLYTLMAIGKAPHPIKRTSELVVEGYQKPDLRTGVQTSHAMAASAVSVFINLGYAETKGDFLVLTDKGRAFIYFLEEKGYVCAMINGEKLVPEYKSFAEMGRK